jgi:biotin transport system substrate-specific component
MPLGVPLTLQTFAIMLAGVVLGGKKGMLAVIVYVLLGAFGAPVFAQFRGGFSVVTGMTGGFILSFPLIALIAGFSVKFNKLLFWAGLVTAVLVNYLCGIIWFSVVTGSTLQAAFTACVLPFIPTDAVKVVLVAVGGRQLKNALEKAFYRGERT